MGWNYSGPFVWRFLNTVAFLYGTIFDFVLGQARLRYYHILDHGIQAQCAAMYGVSKTQCPVWRYFWFCSGPIQSEVIWYFGSRIQTQWSPCMTFPKHSELPVCRYLWCCPGPSQYDVVEYVGSWDPDTVVSLYGAFKTQWSPCMSFCLFDVVLGQANLR